MTTVTELPKDDAIFVRVEEELTWYSHKARDARAAFKRIKLIEIIAASLIPFLTGQPWPYVTYVVGGLGVLITVLEGILHLNQYQDHWTSYRNTAESLKHEKFLFMAKAGPYANAADPKALLAERCEGLISQENTQWQAALQRAAQANQGK